jgi:amino acid adenylation domain-containing protein
MDLTRFPSLFSHELKPENAQWVEKHLRGLRFSEEVISRAWASLLVAITGHHEVFFAVDESFVKVNSPSFNITKVDPAKQKHKRSEESTGVFLRSQDVPLHSALALIYNVDSESVILKSFGHVPLQYMEHIETYLKVAVDWFQGQEHSPVPLSWLSMLPKSISNEIPKAFPGDQLLHDIIASQGNHCAIDFRSTNGERIKLSFQEVNDRSTQLASSIFLQLGSRASCEQPIIAIYLPQSPELYISQIAILKVGCAFCCVNLDTPQDRLKFILNDIRAEILLTVPQYVEYISTIDIKCLLVDEPPALTSVMDTFHRVFEVSPKDTAYVMYTSGSTGLPKGVPVPHGAVTQSLLAHDEHMPPFSRFLQFAAPTFDVSIFEIYFTFYRGKTLVCCERMALLNDLVEIMNECDVDAAELTPTVAASLLRRRDAVPKLNLLLTIGEMLTTPVVHAFGGNEQQKSLLWAMYGPTEAAIHCTIQPALRSSSKVGIIGRPLRTASAFIISHPEYYDSSESAFEVLPEGFVGELAIGGFQLAGGYLNRPDQTASVFIDDSPWGRVYRTGDKARMLPDGSFECLGRISSGQVKLRGQRVELGEIEQTALRVRGCSNAVASIIENMLILFCSVDQGRLSEQIMTECERWLPSHMVPNDIVILHEFPHLASGKVDKNQLKENYQRTLNYDLSNENNLADETTSNIYKALQDVLGRSFPPSSQLTSVGVDSLIAIKLASQLRGMNYQIQPIDILRSNHLSDLRNLALQPNQADKAKSMEAEMAKIQDNSPYLQNLARSNSLLVSQWLDVDKIVKCSTTQIGMLTETAIDPLAYCNWIEIRVPTGINEPALKAYLRQIVANHDILRSGFVQTNSPGHEYLQIIWKTGQESDFLSVKDIEKKGFVMEDTSFMSRPIRFQLQLTENQDNRVLIQLHHALYDGWSMDLLIRDLELLFNGGTLMSCEQFQRVQNYYEHYDMEESLANWQDYLVQCSPTLLPSFDQDNNAPSNEPSSIHRFSCKMADLRNGASKLQITPQCYFQAAIIYLIGRIIGSPDIIIGTVTSGRMIPVEGIEEIFGPCMRTLPLRINLSYSKYGIDLLRNIHLLNRRLAEHSAVSMKDVKRSCGVDPGVPLSDALFIWQESLQSRYDNSTAFEIIDSSNNVEFKLIVEIEPRGDDLIGKISSRGWNPPFPLQYLLTKVDEIVVRLLQNSGTVLDHFLDVIPQFSRQIFEDQTPSIVVQDSQTEDEKWAAGEHIIRTCISDITGVPESKIQKHVSMFRYGVDSMSAIHLARLLRQRGFTSTSVSMILKHSTVSRLARAISIAKESQDSVASDKIDLLPSQLIRDIKAMFIEKGLQLEKVLPCTPLQEVMLSSHYSSDWNAYCNLMVFKIVGNPLKLMASFDAVIKRHEIFRTVFIQSDNSTFPFVQAVLPNNIDLWDTEAADHEYSEFDLRSNMLQAGRHLARLIDNMAPPISLRKVPNGEAVYLELICHHAVYDAYAMQLLIHDVECHYQQKELMLPPSSERFLQYSQSVQSRDSENFWLNTLKGFQPIVFHYTQSVNINVCSRPLIISLENLEMSCREQSTTLMVVLQATLAKLLAHVLHSEDVCFGNVVSGRTNSIDSLDRLVFPTFNTVPLRIKFSQFSNNTSLLTFIQNFSITSEPFNLFPLRKIQNGLELGGDALFSAILLLQQGIYELNSSIWELVMDSGNMDVSSHNNHQ